MAKQKYYVVWLGKEPGIYKTWQECERQIRNFDGAVYKSFVDEGLARQAYEDDHSNYIGKDFGKLNEQEKKIYGKPIEDSICVDAACSGNPGIMEYRGVDKLSGAELFRMGPFQYATVNIGEFLAIVHGLAYLAERDFDFPIYTDSRTAMKWVRDKKINTKLERVSINERVFVLLDRAIKWLETHDYSNKIIKWETAAWGEIPADFGRK
ncbi:MAG: viroplasmin family protein [Bacteroidetes bacterium]|nr:viroplasmin family protein [Bacteroidota bacterium]